MAEIRIEGFDQIRLDKVMGRKVYASDLRPGDLGWEGELLHALLLRAPVANGVFRGVDEKAFPRHCRPVRTVTAAELGAAGIRQPVDTTRPGERPWESFGPYWLVPEGKAPDHVGQAVAVAYFETLQALRDAVEWIRQGGHPIRQEPPSPGTVIETDIRRLEAPLLGIVEREELSRYGSTHHLRLSERGKEIFPDPASPDFRNQKFANPFDVRPRKDPQDPQLRANRQARETWQRIENTIADEGWAVLDRTFYTPIQEPMFMEPEAGLSWWDEAKRTLHLVVGTQSPAKDVQNVARMLGIDVNAPSPDKRIELHPRYPGGGFGGRDDSSFTPFLALVAFFANGRPVRLAHDRYEQFLVGIKRHAAVVRNRLAYSPDGTLQALVSNTVMDGGGEANLTQAVVGLAALHAAGPYNIPRTVINAYGVKTPGAPAGSMRGFGIPQVAFALETMIDEVAERCRAQQPGLDAIELRKRHALKRGDREVTGMLLEHHLANVELCEMAAHEPLWTHRAAEKQRRDRPGSLLYGVGFAMCMEAYGTTKDAAVAEVSIDARGRVTVASGAVDMGQGAATALAIATRPTLGRAADQVEMAQVYPRFTDLLRQLDRRSKGVNAMSASMTAFHKVHAVEEACKVLWDHGLAPAAQALTGAAEVQPVWRDGALVVGDRLIPLEDLAREAHARQLVVSAQVHTCFQHRFASGRYPVQGKVVERDVDALRIRFGGAAHEEAIQAQGGITFPTAEMELTRRTLYASAAHLLAVEVHVRSGIIEVVDAVSFVDAGKVHHRPSLEGQIEGGLAMGIGLALMEELPPGPEGVDGRWNLHRYEIPRARHVPLRSMGTRLVPFPDDGNILPAGARIQRKGVAEAVMTTVPPAIANAVAHATGLRMNRVPITPSRMREALAQR